MFLRKRMLAKQADREAMEKESIAEADKRVMAELIRSHKENNPTYSHADERIVKFRKGQLLGRGGFGAVYQGVLIGDRHQLVAIKEFAYRSRASMGSASKEDDESARLRIERLIEHEVEIMRKLCHPNIVFIFGTCKTRENFQVIMEYAHGNTLRERINGIPQRSANLLRFLTLQVCEALEFLHGKGIAHRDLKCSNLLVKTDFTVMLADFGSAWLLDPAERALRVTSDSFTAAWAAPELILGKEHDEKVDIWSLGCCLIEMATGKDPWAECEFPSAAVCLLHVTTTTDLPAVPADLDDDAQDFIRLCLQRDPALRPSASALLLHPFLASYPLNTRAAAAARAAAGASAAVASAGVALSSGPLQATAAATSGLARSRGAGAGAAEGPGSSVDDTRRPPSPATAAALLLAAGPGAGVPQQSLPGGDGGGVSASASAATPSPSSSSSSASPASVAPSAAAGAATGKASVEAGQQEGRGKALTRAVLFELWKEVTFIEDSYGPWDGNATLGAAIPLAGAADGKAAQEAGKDEVGAGAAPAVPLALSMDRETAGAALLAVALSFDHRAAHGAHGLTVGGAGAVAGGGAGGVAGVGAGGGKGSGADSGGGSEPRIEAGGPTEGTPSPPAIPSYAGSHAASSAGSESRSLPPQSASGTSEAACAAPLSPPCLAASSLPSSSSSSSSASRAQFSACQASRGEGALPEDVMTTTEATAYALACAPRVVSFSRDGPSDGRKCEGDREGSGEATPPGGMDVVACGLRQLAGPPAGAAGPGKGEAS